MERTTKFESATRAVMLGEIDRSRRNAASIVYCYPDSAPRP